MKELVFGKYRRASAGRVTYLIKVYVEDLDSGVSGMLNLTVRTDEAGSCELEDITHDIAILKDEGAFSILRESFKLKLEKHLVGIVRHALDSCDCFGWDGSLPEPRYLDADIPTG